MAKPAAKKKAQGASRNTPPASSGRKGAPGWVWLLTGFVLACFVLFLVHIKQSGGGIGKVLPALPGSTVAGAASSGAPANDTGDDTATSGQEQRYDFYSLLSNQKVTPTQAAADAATKAAAAAALATKKQAAMAAADQAAASGITPPATQQTVDNPVPVTEPTPTPTVAEEPPATPAEPKTTEPKAAAKGSYFLQAGSFKSESEADRRRASIILLGLPVKTQMVVKDDQNWYRVIVGPMDSKDSLDSARSSLQGSGIATVVAKKG